MIVLVAAVHTVDVGLLSVHTTSGPRMPPIRPVALTIHELVQTHFDLVWRWLRAFGVARDDADDAAQQVFLVAAGKMDAIVPGSERAFLFGTARGVAANQRRMSKRRPPLADEAEIAALLDASPNPEETLGDQEARAVLEHLIARLDDDLRDVFILFQLEELPTAEIADILQIPIGTVASRLRRAREAFSADVNRIRTARARTHGGLER